MQLPYFSVCGVRMAAKVAWRMNNEKQESKNIRPLDAITRPQKSSLETTSSFSVSASEGILLSFCKLPSFHPRYDAKVNARVKVIYD